MNLQLSSSLQKPWARIQKGMTALPVAVLALQAVMPMAAQAIDFPDTGDRGAPSTTAGGGTRGGWCDGEMEWSENALIPMVPKNNVSTFAGDQASLWIVAAPEFSQRKAEIFVRSTQTNETVYVEETTLGDLRTESVIQVDLPALNSEGEPLLATDQSYFWEFAVICNSGAREHDYYVRGLIQPVDANAALAAQLEAATTPEEQAALYASDGIWQETLNIGVQLSDSNPELLAELLTSVGLDELLSQ